MFNIVLFQPEIPPNTGNVIRLVANTGSTLHLIEPLGFDIDEKRVKRAGLDYHEMSQVFRWPDWETFLRQTDLQRLFAFTTKAETSCYEAHFKAGDTLVFGPETRGLPKELLAALPKEQKLRLPMQATSRSLNLSNTVAIALYEALRQTGFSGLS
ncbi:MAG: tRNA (uridine(34)/cytosine(34)/5-carboxymethylaminomethyluridine(34)-2'-O)-methyltransferase TrmL [Pseudohongiella sp.]|nr:tRNA (uridine(34)/cytosine(34)/5-carboxymethylaminomethyluridine(34)-2'-O)-methyltransferase TrmL [Pseudohongiella sp.]MDP1756629.1 tRNA (uridine(34)/cytosine(34)/5-carboxymethylaminomethyluridine(34)-2'-O)-methyltransferase TrmL [Pseudohongiella sp.]